MFAKNLRIIAITTMIVTLVFAVQYYGQQINAISIKANLVTANDLPNYIPHSVYYYLKNLTVHDENSTYPAELIAMSGQQPRINVDPDAIFLSGKVIYHVTPHDTNFSSITINLPITHIRNDTNSITIDADGKNGYVNLNGHMTLGIQGRIIFDKRTGAGSLQVGNSNIPLINARLNSVVNFCLKSLPKGYATCDSQLSPAVSKICAEHIGQPIDACSDGKVAQYYKIRSSEIAKNSAIINGSKNKIDSITDSNFDNLYANPGVYVDSQALKFSSFSNPIANSFLF
ncbi:MAG: hypothetical protein WA631_02840 [Nitrososphaeraceae archaeon]